MYFHDYRGFLSSFPLIPAAGLSLAVFAACPEPGSFHDSATDANYSTSGDSSSSTATTAEPAPTTGDSAGSAEGRICVVDRDGFIIDDATIRFDAETVLGVDDLGCADITGAPGVELVGRIEAPGYLEASAVLPLGDAPRSTLVRLVARPQGFELDAGLTHTRTVGHATVTIPAHAVRDPDTKQPIAGTYTLTIAPLDPTLGLEVAPGPLVGRTADDATVPLESYLMAELSVWQGNKRLELDPALGATLEFLIPPAHPRHAELAAGQEIAAWWFDVDRGLWINDGAGLLVQRDAGLTWTKHVEHFTWWNADAPWTEKTCFQVEVYLKLDGEEPILVTDPSFPVTAKGLGDVPDSYAGFDTDYTDQGFACVEAPLGKTTNLYVGTYTEEVKGTETKLESHDVAASCDGQGGKCKPVVLLIEQAVCEPGKSLPGCFPMTLDPPQAIDQGICTPGTQLCMAPGFYSACEGFVTPAVDVCKNGIDEDCDGVPDDDDCPMIGCNDPKLGDACVPVSAEEYHFDYGKPATCKLGVWECDNNVELKCNTGVGPLPKDLLGMTEDENCNGWPAPDMTTAKFDGALDQIIDGVAASSDRVYVVGRHAAPMDIKNANGNKQVEFPGGTGLFIAALDATTLEPLTAYPLTTRPIANKEDVAIRIAVDESGDPFVAGYCSTQVTLPGLIAPCAQSGQVFLAALDKDLNPKPNGLAVFGDTGLRRLDLGAAGGRFFIAVDHVEAFNFFNKPVLASADAQPDVFVGIVDLAQQAGAIAVDRKLPGPQRVRALAVDPNKAKMDQAYVYVAAEDADGSSYVETFPDTPMSFQKSVFAATEGLSITSIAVDENDRVIVAGTYSGKLVTLAGVAVGQGSEASDDLFVARFNPHSPEDPVVRHLPAPAQVGVADIAALGGDVVLTGRYTGEFQAGGLPLSSPGITSGFVIRLAADGLKHVWTRNLTGIAMGTALATRNVDALWRVFVAAEFRGMIDLEDPNNELKNSSLTMDSGLIHFTQP